jgi:hypothetical protein
LSALDARRRPDSTVDLLVANEGRMAVPCQDRSRRRRWPKASLYKELSPGHARSPRATIECACGDKCSGAGKCPHPAANSPEVNVLREMGKFKPVIFGQIHAAGDTITKQGATPTPSKRFSRNSTLPTRRSQQGAISPNWRRGNGVRRQPPPSGWALAARHGCILRPASAWRAGDDPVVGKRDAGAARVGVAHR